MRIVVDAHMVGSRETGNERYLVNLLCSMAGVPGVECAAAVRADKELPAALSDAGLDLIVLDPPGDWTRLVYTLSRACRRWQADVLHVTYVAPFFAPCPVVVTVHDVSFRRYPSFFSPKDRMLFATLLPFTLRRASAVVAVSRHAQKEIVEAYPFLDSKVHVTAEAADPHFRPVRDKELLQTARSRYGIGQDFILAVGNLQPRKNLLRLINAFASVREQVEAIQLVVVGKAQWQASAVYDSVKRMGLEEEVLFLGHVPDRDLVMLYNCARVFVYPSIYEGFGLPVLEAMACGTPVITSNASSLPEVAGDAAILVDPFSQEQIAHAVRRVLQDSELALSLSRKGLERAQQFSWQKAAQETVAAYQTVLDRVEYQEALR